MTLTADVIQKMDLTDGQLEKLRQDWGQRTDVSTRELMAGCYTCLIGEAIAMTPPGSSERYDFFDACVLAGIDSNLVNYEQKKSHRSKEFVMKVLDELIPGGNTK